jgi:hypothetical protein
LFLLFLYNILAQCGHADQHPLLTVGSSQDVQTRNTQAQVANSVQFFLSRGEGWGGGISGGSTLFTSVHGEKETKPCPYGEPNSSYPSNVLYSGIYRRLSYQRALSCILFNLALQKVIKDSEVEKKGNV